MAYLIKRDYVDAESKEIIRKGTVFDGESEKLKRLLELGIVSEVHIDSELPKEKITRKANAAKASDSTG
nr:hypothetical protein [uncultured Trichococcus sp.]